jgi:hypothetical protein
MIPKIDNTALWKKKGVASWAMLTFQKVSDTIFILAAQPHSLCVETWNRCLWSQADDLYSFLFNTQMSVESLLYAPWTFHEAQTDMADV